MNWKKGCLIAFCVLVVLVVAILALVFYLTSGAVESADEFLDLIGAGDIGAAYAATAPAFQQQQSEASFRDAVARLGLTEYESRSWTNRSVEGAKAELSGTITTRAGDEIPLDMSLIKVAGDWRVLTLTGPAAGAFVTTPDAAPRVAPPPPAVSPVPEPDRLRQLALESLLALNSSVVTGDFSTFYAGISELWQGQTSPEELASAFAQFVEREIDFSAIADVEPTFDTEPEIDHEGALRIAGVYPTEGARVQFSLRYISESGVWKLLAIEVNLIE